MADILAAMASYPIIFVAGPWAAGKTRISTKLHMEFGYLHFDLDRHGFDFYNVQPEWDEFRNRLNPVPLVLLLKNRIMAEQRPAAVVSFPQEILLTRAQIEAGKSVGVTTAILWGEQELCKAAYLARIEAKHGRSSTRDALKSDRETKHVFDYYGRPKFDDCRIEVFSADGSHVGSDQIISYIKQR